MRGCGSMGLPGTSTLTSWWDGFCGHLGSRLACALPGWRPHGAGRPPPPVPIIGPASEVARYRLQAACPVVLGRRLGAPTREAGPQGEWQGSEVDLLCTTAQLVDPVSLQDPIRSRRQDEGA